MNRWKVILAAALIFVCGIVTGALALRAANQKARTTREHSGPPSFMDPRFDALKKMQDELALTPVQTQRIDAILQEGRKRMRQVWDTCQPQMKDEMKRVRERIEAELNEEQRPKYDALMKRSKERRGNWQHANPTNSGPPVAEIAQ